MEWLQKRETFFEGRREVISLSCNDRVITLHEYVNHQSCLFEELLYPSLKLFLLMASLLISIN